MSNPARKVLFRAGKDAQWVSPGSDAGAEVGYGLVGAEFVLMENCQV